MIFYPFSTRFASQVGTKKFCVSSGFSLLKRIFLYFHSRLPPGASEKPPAGLRGCSRTVREASGVRPGGFPKPPGSLLRTFSIDSRVILLGGVSLARQFSLHGRVTLDIRFSIHGRAYLHDPVSPDRRSCILGAIQTNTHTCALQQGIFGVMFFYEECQPVKGNHENSLNHVDTIVKRLWLEPASNVLNSTPSPRHAASFFI